MKEDKLDMHHLKAGMILSRSIYDDEGRLLLPQDFVLTAKSIMQLELSDISYVYVKTLFEPQTSEDYELNRVEKIRQTEEFKVFEAAHTQAVKVVKESLNQLLAADTKLDGNELMQQMEHIIAANKNNMQVFDMLHCIRDFDDETYNHCVNVALICHVMGKWLGFDQKDVEDLTLAGLLHDTGKLMMPKEIITKPGRLTPAEYTVIKTHPEVGYQILQEELVDERIKLAARQHHEKNDGSGYPNGLKANDISDFAKIVTIADIYDAMTADRVYRTGLCPFDVIELFEGQGFEKFDIHYLLTFMEHIVQAYINKDVLLSDGNEAKIVMINKTRLSRPVVASGSNYIDLSKNMNISIKAVL